MKTAIAAVLLLCVAGVAQAGVLYPDAITFGPSYALGPRAGTPWLGDTSDIGTSLIIFGTINAVGAPFSDLLPAPPYELTCVIEGATCGGVEWWDNLPCSGGTGFNYSGGVMSLFLDSTPDADFTNPDSFRDGELVLQADMNGIFLTDDDPQGNCPMADDQPDVGMYASFNGGSWLNRIAASATVKGELPGYYPEFVPEALRQLGYVLRIDGSISVSGPVAVEQSTWGRVKSLYR